MPLCLRCGRIGHFVDNDPWLLMNVVNGEYVDIYNDGPMVGPMVRLRPNTIRSSQHTLFIGLCSRCQLSEAQIENMWKDE